MTNKITLSTVKSFVKKNENNLFINLKSSFDGMTDCVEKCNNGFSPAKKDKTQSISSDYFQATLGYEGIWLVRGSRDYFQPFENERFLGIEVSNSCGSFIIATTK